MAVVFVDAGPFTTQSNAGEAFNVSVPTGGASANGDLLVLECFTYGGTVPTPSGWNLAFSVAMNGSADIFYVFWRIRDGTEGTNVSVDPSSSRTYGIMSAWTGHNITNPIGGWLARRSNVDGTDPVAPGMWAPAGAAVLITGIQGSDWTDYTDPTGDGLTWHRIDADGHSPLGTTRSQGTNYAITTTDIIISDKTFVATGGSSSVLYGLTFIIAPANIRDVLIDSTGAGNITAPASATAVRMEVHGGGGGGGSESGAECGGGAGAVSVTNSVTVTGGSTIVYYSVGTGGGAATDGGDSWARAGTNSAPTSTTDGCLAKGGVGAATGGGAGGDAAAGVGNTKWSGVAGAIDQGGGGTRAGSGGGYSPGPSGNAGTSPTAGSGSTPGVGGIAADGGANGGNGGLSGATGGAGQAPGGGGGGGGNSGGNAGAGARGQVRLIFTLSGPAVGVSNETDTAYNRGLNWIPNLAAAALTTDTASARSPLVVLAVQRPIETDSAFRRTLAHAIGRANETDLAFALSQGIIQLPVGQANETDTAFKAGGIAMSPNRPIETDTASARGVILQVQRADETDQAFQRDRLGGVGVSIEADTAFALGKVFILPVGRAPIANADFSSNYIAEWSDFDATLTVVAGRLRVTADNTVGVQATATFPSFGPSLGVGNVVRVQGEGFAGTANAVVQFDNGAAALPSQTNTAFDLQTILTSGSVKFDATLNDLGAVSVGQFAEFDNFIITTWPREVDTAFALARLDTPSWTRSNETDTAFSRVAGFPVVRSNETDLAFARTGVIIRATQRADEVSTAFARNSGVFIPVARADETSTASRLGFGTPAVPAIEADSAFARNALITIDHGYSQEIDTAFQMFGALSAGSGRKPHLRFDRLLRDRIQPVYKGQ